MTNVIIQPDPIVLASKLPAPSKHYQENMEYRAFLGEAGGNSEVYRDAIFRRIERDPEFFFDAFLYTQNPKDCVYETVQYNDDGDPIAPVNQHIPIITWPKQAEYLRWLDYHIASGKPGLVEKSREQAATVSTCGEAVRRFLTKTNANMRIGSRVENLIDGDSFAGQIMPKMDYMLERLHAWMLPEGFKPGRQNRKYLTIKNPVSGNTIDGEPTNKFFAVSGRFALVWVDEATKNPLMRTAHKAISNTTNCYIYTFTPEGWEFVAELVHSGHVDVFTMLWTENPLWHPRGFKNCTWHKTDPSKRNWPEKWICKKGECKAHDSGGMPHSERYDRECKKFGWDKKTIAQELDIDYQKSGSPVFDPEVVTRTITLVDGLRDKKLIEYDHYSFDFVTGNETISAALLNNEEKYYRIASKWPVKATKCDNSMFRIIRGYEPGPCKNPECVCKRIPGSQHVYSFGGDVSKGLAHGDGSAAYIIDCTLGMLIAEWHGKIHPLTLGLKWAQACKWFGTSSGFMWNCWAAPEWNENGLVVAQAMDWLGIFVHRTISEDKRKEKRQDYLGVQLNHTNKCRDIVKYLVPEINNTDADGFPRLIAPWPELWRECQTFINQAPVSDTTVQERPKFKGQGKMPDDRVLAMFHTVYGAKKRFGGIRNVVYKPNKMWVILDEVKKPLPS